MLKIEFSYTPPDVDKMEFDFPCPVCRLETTITFGQVRREEYFICRGCHLTIKAVDQLAGTQRLKQIMENVFR